LSKTKLAIFASGGGSNAEKIIEYFSTSVDVEVSLILSNNANAYVLERAANHNIPSFTFNASELHDSEKVIDALAAHDIHWIVLAGFLQLIPLPMIKKYNNRIINIHPALLPQYGGKGMYGHHVHRAVFNNFEKESGITIHLVNEEYDKGRILFQTTVKLTTTDTPDLIASKVLQLEHEHYAPIIENTIMDH
jgi:phosphoribosylglycinamide formyltransferase-1